MNESGVIEKTALVFGQMNEPPGSRMRVGLTGLTMAEYFRDELGQDVLLFIDNIFRFIQAGSEVSALLGRIPSAVGYQPTLATEMGALQERITSTKKGQLLRTGGLCAADDLTDPAPATTLPTLMPLPYCQGILLNREFTLPLTLRFHFKGAGPQNCRDEHYTVARKVQEILQRYKELQDIIAILGLDELSEEDSS